MSNRYEPDATPPFAEIQARMQADWDKNRTREASDERKRVALISGCFDGLHVGHRYILTEIRKLAPYTIVTLNSDAYLRRKGPGRPLNAFETRRAALYESGLVDEVIAIEDSPLDVIKTLRPDLICVGRNDYTLDQIVGSKECLAWGGQIVIISPDMGVTTTQMVQARLNPTP